MILVEIYVACVDKSYDFKLDKMVTIEEIIEEIVAIINQKEDLNISKQNLTLSIVEKNVIMNKQLTLSDYNICQGSKLILV